MALRANTIRTAAVVWALAEATFFFIVPDVLLTAVAVEDRRRALAASLWAVPGALLGGVLMYAWGTQSIAGAETFLDRVPAVGIDMIRQVRIDLATEGLQAMFLGPLLGRPYKIYAVEAGGMGIALPWMILVSIPARWIRFAALSWITATISRKLARTWSRAARYTLLAACWSIFYSLYFWFMPS